MNPSFCYGYRDYPKLASQFDITSRQLALHNPFRLAVFREVEIYQEGVCQSPYSIDTERSIELLAYWVCLSFTEETYTCTTQLAVPQRVEITKILEKRNTAILIDVSSSQIAYTGVITGFHKYQSNNAELVFNKAGVTTNYHEFIEDVIIADS